MIASYRILKCVECNDGIATIRHNCSAYSYDHCSECNGHGHLVERMEKDEDGVYFDTFMIGDIH